MSQAEQFQQCLIAAGRIVSAYRAMAPEGCDPQNTWAAVAFGVGGAAVSGIGAISSRKAGKQARSDALKAQEAQAKAIAEAQAGLAELYGEQRDPAEIFREILLSMPELLDQVLPDLRRHSKETAVDFTKSNLDTFDLAINRLFPKYKEYQNERLRVIDQLNPERLGREEILGVARKVSPLIPEGTFDPKTGGVQGGTQNAVSLYRNLVGGMYADRRNQYLGEVKQFLGEAENSALRQQEKASSFLPSFLGLGFESAGRLTGATLEQEQGQIANQNAFLQALLGMPIAQYNPAAYDAATSSAVQAAIGGLSSAAGAYFSRRPSSSAYGMNPSVSQLSGGMPISRTPSSLPNYKSALP